MVPLGNEIVDLSALVVRLSWSRKPAVIWSRISAGFPVRKLMTGACFSTRLIRVFV